MVEASCDNCKFFLKHDSEMAVFESKDGVCIRYPPVLYAKSPKQVEDYELNYRRPIERRNLISAEFPPVFGDTKCGEWQEG